MVGIIKEKDLYPETKKELAEKLGGALEGIHEHPLTPPEIKTGAGEAGGGVTPREHWRGYKREERKAIAQLGKAAADKKARGEIVKKYNLPDGRVLHGWMAVYLEGMRGSKNKAGKPAPDKPAIKPLKEAAKIAAELGEQPNPPPPAEKKPTPGEQLENLPAEEKPSNYLTVKVRVNTEQLDKDIAAAREKAKEFARLRTSGLPKFRWWWVFFPGFAKKYLEIFERLMTGK